ncbi:MAG TPA: cupin domain-containing protein [Terriglobales bacterium]|nr:cupin domain-containing protein [Terriglobales bacterium]
MNKGGPARALLLFKIPLLLFLVVPTVRAQTRQVDPTWLHRYVPQIKDTQLDLTSPSCHYAALFGEGDHDSRVLINVARFGEATLDAEGKCQSVQYEREEELYFVLAGKGTLQYSDHDYPWRANDFTYIAPGVKHSILNSSKEALRVVVMTFKIPSSISISAPPAEPKVVNMSELKEETVQGHPASVLYKLMAGTREGTRDAIDQAYVMVSLFWMDFAPGGTNFPHHHESAEEIYLVVDGSGDMVAGGGMDGIEGRHPAKAGDAYYFRPNCTVGFYNQNKPGAKAHILAVRSSITLPKAEE